MCHGAQVIDTGSGAPIATNFVHSGDLSMYQVPTCCSVLQCVQCVAVCCSVFPHFARFYHLVCAFVFQLLFVLELSFVFEFFFVRVCVCV